MSNSHIRNGRVWWWSEGCDSSYPVAPQIYYADVLRVLPNGDVVVDDGGEELLIPQEWLAHPDDLPASDDDQGGL